MRLVDAEDLMRCITKEYNRRGTGDGLRLAWIEKAVNDAPTITPDMAQVLAYECGKSERKRGKWIKISITDDGYAVNFRCSCCKESDVKYPWKYCPNCGAEMRGEANEKM